MRRALAIGGIVASSLAVSACTPNQIAFWMDRQAEVAATPDLQDDADLADAYSVLPDVPDTPCSQWYWWAIEAGWSHELWISFVSYVMPRESNCDPNAYNPSGATSLLQVMPMWADDCGTTREGLFDPLTNLKCGKHIYDIQGPEAWSTW